MVAMPGFPATLGQMKKRLSVSTSRSAGLLAVAVAWALFLALTGSPEAILFTVPVFLLAAPLAIGRYVGENLIVALRSGPRRRFAAVPVIRFGDSASVLIDLLGRQAMPGRGPPVFTP